MLKPENTNNSSILQGGGARLSATGESFSLLDPFKNSHCNFPDCFTSACYDVKCYAQGKSVILRGGSEKSQEKRYFGLRPQYDEKRQKAAFTLAEVLITLGIIGVVAAMTLPMLIAKYQEKVLVTAAKKGYSIAVNTVTRWNAANEIVGDSYNFFATGGSSNNWSSRTVVTKELAKYLKIVQVCDSSNNIKNCGGKYTVKQYKKLNNGQGGTKEETYMNYFRIVLADGSFIAPQSEVTDDGMCKHTFWSNATDSNGFYIPDTSGNSPTGFQGEYKSSDNCGYIHIDTNGLKGPNQVGKDYFRISFSKAGKPSSRSNSIGNLDYVLKYDKLIETEDYTPQESGAFTQ